MRKPLRVCVYVNTALAVMLSLHLLVVPTAIFIHDLYDPEPYGGSIPRCAFHRHRALPPG